MIGQQTLFNYLNDNQTRCVERISYEETKPFLLGIHYARRMPSISYAFGLFEGGGVGWCSDIWVSGIKHIMQRNSRRSQQIQCS